MVKLTCRTNKLFVKSIGHQWLRQAPSERGREREERVGEWWGGEVRVEVSERGQK